MVLERGMFSGTSHTMGPFPHTESWEVYIRVGNAVAHWEIGAPFYLRWEEENNWSRKKTRYSQTQDILLIHKKDGTVASDGRGTRGGGRSGYVCLRVLRPLAYE